MNIRVFTAFSGYDSQCLALQRLADHNKEFGFELVGWSEIDKYAIQAHNAIFPQWEDRNYGDISKVDWASVPDFDLFTYSSPCQDFSQAGMQKGGAAGSGTRSSLLWECERAIAAKRPKLLLFENVPALVSNKFISTFQQWQARLQKYGYTNFAQVLNAKNYGIPQNRERIFMISILDCTGTYNFPPEIPLEKCLKDVLDVDVDESYYLSEDKVANLKLKIEADKVYIDQNTKEGKVEIKKGSIFDASYPSSTTRRGRVQCNGELSPTLCASSDMLNVYEGMTKKNTSMCKVAGDLNIEGRIESANRVYDTHYLCPTLNTFEGGGHEIKILLGDSVHPLNRKMEFKGVESIKPIAPTLTEHDGKGAPSCIWLGDSVDPTRHKLEFRGASSIMQVSPSLRATDYKGPSVVWSYESLKLRIRKLTPNECFKLMGVNWKYRYRLLNSGISKSQLYKMAGNSIVVDVLYWIFYKLFIDPGADDGQLTIFDL